MGRQQNPDLITTWKLNVPSTIAGQVEFLLNDGLFERPKYGARGQLIASLLEWWAKRESNLRNGLEPNVDLPEIPTALDLQQR